MELLDINLVKDLLGYGFLAMGFGIVIIAPIELLIFGVIKAFRLISALK